MHVPTQEMYSHHEGVFQEIINVVVSDWEAAQETGIEIPGQGLVYPCILGNKGDWSYLVPRPWQAYVFFVI